MVDINGPFESNLGCVCFGGKCFQEIIFHLTRVFGSFQEIIFHLTRVFGSYGK